MRVGGQRHAPAALPPGKTRYPLYRRLGGPQGRSGRVQKISPAPGFDPRTVHPVASRYTDFTQKRNHKLHVRLICPFFFKKSVMSILKYVVFIAIYERNEGTRLSRVESVMSARKFRICLAMLVICKAVSRNLH